ncbi:DUF427-domain-containing protein [Nemania sp. FL0916]|nr:DUF427-domain-containing protein [Nemania sp. FL0916]
MPPPPKNLDELACSLLTDGPVRTLPAAPKRVRIQLGGQYVADTTAAVYVWEHPYYPTYYVPLAAFANGVLEAPDASYVGYYGLATLHAGGKSTDRVIVFADVVATTPDKGKALAGLVRVEFGAVDAWFEEDVRVDVHIKDPFKRVDVFYSSRPVRVLINGTEVASAGASFQLYETGLPVRFYLPATSVKAEFLRESKTVTACPYKGEANYYDVVLKDGKGGEKEYKDVVWYYKNPKMECVTIAGTLCFYNEKVDIELDGTLL